MEQISLSDGNVIDRYADFASRYITPRHVDVWVPPEYSASSDLRCPVIYMQDGQNLFDPDTSSFGVDWGVDEAMVKLTSEQKIAPALVVGIWSNEARVQDYMPQQPLEDALYQMLRTQFIDERGGPPQSDNYLRFLIEELKPRIDADYRTLPDPAHTLIMGSSMGALISLYASIEQPQVFGGAGCVSTHWPIGGEALLNYLEARLPKPGAHKFYFDYGTETLDAAYEPYQQRVNTIMEDAGYESGKDWITLKFEGAEHSERAWRKRVHLPLQFLLRS